MAVRVSAWTADDIVELEQRGVEVAR